MDIGPSDAARRAHEQSLELYTAIREPYSIGLTHWRLARMAAHRSTLPSWA